jgi:hypothetical protein
VETDRGVEVRVPVTVSYVSPLHVVQTGSGALPVSYPIDTVTLSLGLKLQEREANATSAEVKSTI